MYLVKFILWLKILAAYTLCIKYVLYHKPSCGDGHRLISNTLSAVNVRSHISCSEQCSADAECQSFNLIKVNKNKYKYLCELKATWDEDMCSSAMFQSDSNSTFFTLVKNSTILAGICSFFFGG